MIAALNLWEPSQVALTVNLLTAFLLGLVHGITPDEHTWPITFSYAIGGYSTRRGFTAGLIFSLAFAAQQALASELAYLGLAHWFTFERLDEVLYIIVGIVMAAAGLFVMGRGALPHLHLPGFGLGRSADTPQLRELKPWMPAVHGFIAGWGLDAFSLTIYTTLAPAMPSAATGWLPGLVFGLGTLCVQAVAGAAFGAWAARRGMPQEAIRKIALITAARTLWWGGCAFVLFGVFALAFPGLAELGVTTPLRVPNLHVIGLPFLLVLFTVVGVGVTSFVTATQACRRRLVAESRAAATLSP
jgi:sulfite exporter TauE/SafE